MKDIFDIMLAHEDSYSNLIKTIFDTSSEYRKNFLSLIFGTGEYDLNNWCFDVRKAFTVEGTRKKCVPDILLYHKNKTHFAMIEVKVFASEGDSQTQRYIEAKPTILNKIYDGVVPKDIKESFKYLTIYGTEPVCDHFEILNWQDVGKCLTENVFEQLSQLSKDAWLKDVAQQLKERIISAYADVEINPQDKWVEVMQPELWRGAKAFHDVLKPIFGTECISSYWDQFDSGEHAYQLSAQFIPSKDWEGELLKKITTNYRDCYEFHYEFKYDPVLQGVIGRLDYHLHPYYSQKDVERIEDDCLKNRAQECNKKRAEIARNAKKTWKNNFSNDEVEIDYNGHITDYLLWLLRFSLKIDPNDTVDKVVESLKKRIGPMTSFLNEAVFKEIRNDISE